MYRCIFCQFIKGQVKCQKVYEDENVYAYLDWNLWEPVHIVAFPKMHIGLKNKEQPEFARSRQLLVDTLPKIARAGNLADGYEVITEYGEAHIDQNIEHLHFHLVGQKRE